jgi:integrase
MPFTDKQISALKAKPARYEKKEPGRTGLGIRVTPKGQKSWTLLYRFKGKQRRMILGNYPVMGVAAAHVALAAAREHLKLGVDPGALLTDERMAERNADSMQDLAAEYMERHARKVMRNSSANEDGRLLNREIIPHWGERPAKDITRRDIIKLLDGIEDRGASVLRNRTAGLLSRVFRFAMDRGIINASPAAGIRRLPEKTRDRFLSVVEIRAFWTALDKARISPQVRCALRMLVLTGQRRAEVAGTLRDEIDDHKAVWKVPAERAKNGRENIVPLPPLAMQLIDDADDCRTRPLIQRPNRKGSVPYDPEPSPWLFPSHIRSKPIEPAALTRALNRNREILGIGDATVHDLRRTFATWHGELGTPPDVISALLNHAPTTITGQVYNRASNIEPRRQAMNRWCHWLADVIAGQEVPENVIRLETLRR